MSRSRRSCFLPIVLLIHAISLGAGTALEWRFEFTAGNGSVPLAAEGAVVRGTFMTEGDLLAPGWHPIAELTALEVKGDPSLLLFPPESKLVGSAPRAGAVEWDGQLATLPSAVEWDESGASTYASLFLSQPGSTYYQSRDVAGLEWVNFNGGSSLNIEPVPVPEPAAQTLALVMALAVGVTLHIRQEWSGVSMRFESPSGRWVQMGRGGE